MSNADKGFASMAPEKQKEIARKGGVAAHVAGTAHEWTPDEARLAGKKGGLVMAQNTEHMRRIGRIGGMKSQEKKKASKNEKSTLEAGVAGPR